MTVVDDVAKGASSCPVSGIESLGNFYALRW
jgi:hypothetical protein